jgi:Transposase IS66 family
VSAHRPLFRESEIYARAAQVLRCSCTPGLAHHHRSPCPHRRSVWHRRRSSRQTTGAIRYALSCWKALTRHLDDGLLEIDNSAAERALRAVALVRKNYLFCGADSDGHRAAAIYSLVGSPSSMDWIKNSIFARSPGPDLDLRARHQPHRRISPVEDRPLRHPASSFFTSRTSSVFLPEE